tara:strand:- start:7965 stop:8252 length:288 start_codon:yes stop_codon:yes gene_type:complete
MGYSKFCEGCWDKLTETNKTKGEVVQDNVNSPSHYGQGKIEAIEYISDFLSPEEYKGYLRGNIAKYLHRYPYKSGIEDLKKANWYLGRLIKEMEK